MVAMSRELTDATPDTVEKSGNERLMSVLEGTLAAEGIDLTTAGLIGALNSRRLLIRTEAAILLGRRREVSAIPHLKPLLGDGISVVRVEAAMSLALLGDRSGVPVLVEALDEEFLTTAPVSAASYLAALGDPRGYQTVLKGLHSDLAGIRLAAATALKSFLPYQGRDIDGQPVDLFATVKEVLEDPDPLVRRELLHQVSMLDDPRVSPLLSRVCESDTDEQVRRTAQELLSVRSGSMHSEHSEE